MTLFLDSADPTDAARAFGLGLVAGITTNPALLAARRGAALDPVAAMSELLPVSRGIVFYQLQATSLGERRAEAARALALNPARVGLKIPCTLYNLGLASEMVSAGHIVGVTAIFSAAQVALACQVGAHFVLPYVDRARRLLGDGLGLVREMRAVIDSAGAATKILAASVKSPEQAVATLCAGAHGLTLPLPILEAMAEHDLSRAAIAGFDQSVQDAARAAHTPPEG